MRWQAAKEYMLEHGGICKGENDLLEGYGGLMHKYMYLFGNSVVRTAVIHPLVS